MYNFDNPIFKNAKAARKHLESLRWPNGPVCPHCGVIGGKVYPLKGKSTRAGVYKCSDCRKPFTVTVNTVFEDSKIPLHKWIMAVYLLCSSKKGMSSKQLERMLGVTYKTAWFMSHRIREAMKDNPNGSLLGGAGKIIEADEVYVGGKPRNKGPNSPRGLATKKTPVITILERGGDVRTEIGHPITSHRIKNILIKHTDRNSRLMTDEGTHYKGPGKDFKSHEVVVHSRKEYARADVSVNEAESFHAMIKRNHVGAYHHWSNQHLHRYLTEIGFRWNNRKIEDFERTNEALKGIEGKRLVYME